VATTGGDAVVATGGVDSGWRRVAIGAAVGLAGVAGAACSSSSKSASSTAKTTVVSASASASAGGGEAGQLRSLRSAVQSAKNATFKVTYTTTGGSAGSSPTVTLEQKPPKSLFSSGGSVVINNGTATYYCSGSSGQQTCITSTGTAPNPLASALQIYSGVATVALFQQWESQLSAKLAGLSVTFSDQTFAGQASKCVNWAYQGQSAKYCVTNSGILAFAGGARTSGAGSFELSEYSTNVPDGDFNLPAGATVETIPSATSTT